LIFFYQSKQLTDYIYTDIYCKLSKCIGKTPCSYEHYLATATIPLFSKDHCVFHCYPVYISGALATCYDGVHA